MDTMTDDTMYTNLVRAFREVARALRHQRGRDDVMNDRTDWSSSMRREHAEAARCRTLRR